MAEAFGFHQLSVGVRPARVAVRMGTYDGWEHSALRVIETMSATWGGAGNIIVTCGDDGAAPDDLWSVVELFDPDSWGSHTKTYRGWEIRDPSAYQAFLDKQTDASLPENADRQEWRAQIHDMLMRESVLTSWKPPETFWNRTRHYLAPSWDREFGHPMLVSEDELPSDTLVSVTNLTPLPERVVVPETSSLSLKARVLIASRWGALSPACRTALAERRVPVVDIPITEDDLRGLLSACWGGSTWNTPSLNAALADAISPEIFNEARGSTTHWFDTYGPFAMSMVGVSRFIRVPPMREEWPRVVIVGDSADDFALATAIDRCIGSAVWFPTAIVGPDTSKTVANALATPSDRNDRNRPVFVASCSLDGDAIHATVEELAGAMWSDEIEIHAGFPSLPRLRPISILDSKLGFSNEDELFVGNVTGRGLQARLPSGVSADDPLHLAWWNDVMRTDHQLPPRWPLNDHLVARSRSWKSRARVTREGIAFHSKPLGFIPAGARLEQIVDSPQLRFLDAPEIFGTLSDEAGLTLIESSAGRYTARTTELWGGLESLVADLQRPVVRRILDAYRSKADSGVDPGNLIAERRFLSYDDLKTVVGSDDDPVPFVDWAVNVGVLRRGLSLACSYCSHFGWYDADDVGQKFRCWRCRTWSTIDSGVIRGNNIEPQWYYALTEVVYQASSESFTVPVLALNQFAGNAHSVLGMSDHEVVFRDGDKVEIDLWGVVDGRIVLGEAKTGNDLGSSRAARRRKAKRLRRAADELTADVVVLATASTSWNQASKDAIDEAFEGARCEVQYLQSVDPHLTDT